MEDDIVVEGSKVETIVKMAVNMSKTPFEGFCIIIMAAKMFAEQYKKDSADMERLIPIIKEIMENSETIIIPRSSERAQ